MQAKCSIPQARSHKLGLILYDSINCNPSLRFEDQSTSQSIDLNQSIIHSINLTQSIIQSINQSIMRSGWDNSHWLEHAIVLQDIDICLQCTGVAIMAWCRQPQSRLPATPLGRKLMQTQVPRISNADDHVIIRQLALDVYMYTVILSPVLILPLLGLGMTGRNSTDSVELHIQNKCTQGMPIRTPLQQP